jgi:hypothetical protein
MKSDGDFYCYGWMDNRSVYFLDSGYGPSKALPITRIMKKTRASVEFKVPLAIIKYNMYMGGVDIKDQVDASCHQDQGFRCKKWTTKFFEVLYGRTIGNAYNIQRFLHRNNPVLLLTRTNFQIEAMNHFLDHPMARTKAHLRKRSLDVQNEDGIHVCDLLPVPEGKTRHPRGYCAYMCDVPINKKRTSFYCTKCRVYMHPKCFALYHEGELPLVPKFGKVDK